MLFCVFVYCVHLWDGTCVLIHGVLIQVAVESVDNIRTVASLHAESKLYNQYLTLVNKSYR